jgi:hypothetical protein
VVAVAVSTSNSSKGRGQSPKARSYAAMNFSRASSLSHDPGSPLGAGPAAPVMFFSTDMSRLLVSRLCFQAGSVSIRACRAAGSLPPFMIQTYHYRRR